MARSPARRKAAAGAPPAAPNSSGKKRKHDASETESDADHNEDSARPHKRNKTREERAKSAAQAKAFVQGQAAAAPAVAAAAKPVAAAAAAFQPVAFDPSKKAPAAKKPAAAAAKKQNMVPPPPPAAAAAPVGHPVAFQGNPAAAARPVAAARQAVAFDPNAAAAAKTRKTANVRPAATVAPAPPVAATMIRTPPRPARDETKKKSPFMSPGPASSSDKKTKANGNQSPPLLPQPHHVDKHADDGDDSGYQTGDSDEDVRNERLAKLQTKRKEEAAAGAAQDGTTTDGTADQEHHGPSMWSRLKGYMPNIAVTLVFVWIAMPMPMSLWSELSSLMPLTTETAPCFTNTASDAFVSEWTERCEDAAMKNQLVPCPPAGVCLGGDLIGCGFDRSHGAMFVPKANGMSCELSPLANETAQAIHDRLLQLTVAHKCRERPVISAQSHKTRDGTELAMFDYYDLGRVVDSKQAVEDVDQKLVWADTLSWLEFAIRNKIVTNLALERASDGAVLLGLSQDEVQNLSLPPKCMATQTFVSTLDGINSIVWTVLVDWLVLNAWRAVWFVVDVYSGAFVMAPALVMIFTAITGLIIYVVIERWRLAGRMVKSESDSDRAVASVHTQLQKDTTKWHRVMVLRDVVKNELFANDVAGQKRFASVVWPKVVRRIEKDARVAKRNKQMDGQYLDFWKCQD